MTMKTLFIKSALSTAIALTVVACSGGSNIAGIGGSGYISSGSVTGFGSIFVNGVEFETDTAVFNIDSIPGSQSDLVEGMRVKVSGTINPDGVTGTATSVEFEDQLEGPISSATLTEDADMENKTFTVLGVTVRINADDTVFVGTLFDYDTIASGDNIQISGFFDANGDLQATAVVQKNAFVAGATIIEAKGTISGLSGSNFTLTVGATMLTVDASTADVSQVPGGLADGQFVEVKGTIAAANGTLITSTLVKLEDNNPAEGLEVEIEGIITRFVSASDFDVDDIAVDASTAISTPANFPLSTGIKVEVEGPITGGVLQARTLKLREGNTRAHATASNVNTIANTFDMTIAGQTITVTANTSTRMEDKVTGNPLSLATLANVNGKFLRVRGLNDGTGSGLIATRIRIEDPNDVILQGTIDSQAIGVSVTVLGVTIAVDVGTSFQDINNIPFPGGQADFITATTNGVTLIKIKDKEIGTGGNPVGTADDVELQQP